MTVFLRHLMTACILTLMSAMIHSSTDEYAMYGNLGPPDQNWQPRELAGWPAAFLADSPDTSVIHKIGIEDDFRPGAFVATLSFWYLVSLLLDRTASKFWRIYRGGHDSEAAVNPNRVKDK
jgi:hypothetical protein